MGFRQWTIIMPLIPISCSSVSCCRRCLRCAKRCSFLLLLGFLLTSSSLFTLNLKLAFSLQRSVGGKSFWARIWSHLLCFCVICMGNCSWFTDGKLSFTDDEYRIYSINRPERLLNFWALRVSAYSRWALLRGWALIQFSPFSASEVRLFCNKTINATDKTRRSNKVRFL